MSTIKQIKERIARAQGLDEPDLNAPVPFGTLDPDDYQALYGYLGKRLHQTTQVFSEEEVTSYIAWLNETLIQDLRESGRDATADDFEKCIAIIEYLRWEK